MKVYCAHFYFFSPVLLIQLHLISKIKKTSIVLRVHLEITSEFFLNFQLIRIAYLDGSDRGGLAIFIRTNIKYSIGLPALN